MNVWTIVIALVCYFFDTYSGKNDITLLRNKKKTVKNDKYSARYIEIFNYDESRLIVKLHNHYRSMANPSANLLVWEPRTDPQALVATAACSFKRRNLSHPDFGALAWNQYIAKRKNVTQAFLAWYKEGEVYKNSKSSFKITTKYRNYTQMMSSEIKGINCYWNRCLKNNLYLVGCLYNQNSYDTCSDCDDHHDGFKPDGRCGHDCRGKPLAYAPRQDGKMTSSNLRLNTYCIFIFLSIFFDYY